jgi:alpha-1,6-mannosyltransferase
LFTDKWKASAICLGLGIATKVVAPSFHSFDNKKTGLEKGFAVCCIAGTTTLLLFAFFFDLCFYSKHAKSVDLFFRKFEFNASIYYFVRWIGTLIAGYNLIKLCRAFTFVDSCCYNSLPVF